MSDSSPKIMSDSLNILSLPDLVLHDICRLLHSPFDLLNLGCTCKKMYRITSLPSLWWDMSIKWFSGVWFNIEKIPDYDDAHEWFINVLHDITTKPTGTMTECHFDHEESWHRIETSKFRAYLGMLQLAYIEKMKERHPLVLYERWLYDVALYERRNPFIDFEKTLTLSREIILELCALGQAKERDLRARKQPYIDPVYYIKVGKTLQSNRIEELFPCGPYGSKCPMIICPFQDALNTEVSGMSGLLTCLSLVVEKHVIPKCWMNQMSLMETSVAIRSAIQGFGDLLRDNYTTMKQRWGQYCFTNALLSMATEDIIDLSPWQKYLDGLDLKLKAKLLIQELQSLVESKKGIDGVVNIVRSKWRQCLMPEITQVLDCKINSSKKVTRVNLTDSDLIGGDNRRQEMSAAAFVSEVGVLVTWQLTGRMRY